MIPDQTPSAAAPSGPTPRQSPGKLLKRADFLRTSKGRRYFTPAFALQAARRPTEDCAQAPRFGITITKKVGGSVERNRMRRRLREAIKLAAAMDARPGTDYVIVAQREALSHSFAALICDLEKAVSEINTKLDSPRPPRRPKPAQDTELGKIQGNTKRPASQ